MMKSIAYIICFSLLLLCSCSGENTNDEAALGDLSELDMRLYSIDPDMDIRIIATDATSGQILVNEFHGAPNSQDGNYRVNVKSGKVNFYVIANEPAGLTPSLDGLKHESALKPLKVYFSDLPTVETVSADGTDIPAMAAVSALVKPSDADASKGVASADNGATWGSTLDVELKRLASKVSLSLRKNTQNAAHSITVKRVEIVNIPSYGYLMPASYGETGFLTRTPYSSNTGITFSSNADTGRTDNYTEAFTGFILPEYLPSDAGNADKALCLNVYALYNNQKNVVYRIPVRANILQENYSMHRNTHYHVMATLESDGQMYFEPEITYQVLDWTEVSGEFVFDKTVTHTFSMGDGSPVPGKSMQIYSDGQVEFSFTLANPPGARWTASLTNGSDFYLDTADSAVDNGITLPGRPYTIRIKPLREAVTAPFYTEFYITVDYGLGHKEIDLTGEGVGAGKRYVITQIPN